MLNIEPPYPHKTAFLQLGFRPFFAAAMGGGVLLIMAWMLIYFSGWVFPAKQYGNIQWHAHEMIFGYGMAVAAGFLLTATRNWTGIQTIQNKPLLILFILWCAARILPFVLPASLLWLLAIIDLSFNLFLFVATATPIYQAKQWNNTAFSGKILLMFLANAMFYASLLGLWQGDFHYGLYAGFYTLVALIFTMGRRIIPFFIERGVGYPFQAKNWKWLDISNLILFLLFAIADTFFKQTSPIISTFLAIALFILNSLRLYGWYTKGIWQKSLLWSLYLGYTWLVFGFLLKALSYYTNISPFLALHSFAYGGIGLITIGMMARVSLGHTGRNVFAPPKILSLVYLVLLLGATARVILPLLLPSHYSWWIATAQGLWIIAFGILFVVYIPMFIKPRVDGRAG